MKKITIGTSIYALLILTGGMIGYLKANSLMSLIMGGSFAVLLLLSAISMIKNQVLGYFSAIILTSALTVFFGYRFFTSWKMMPAGMMLILSVAMLGLLFAPKCTRCHSK